MTILISAILDFLASTKKNLELFYFKQKKSPNKLHQKYNADFEIKLIKE
jgi:hypothetical protein